METKLVFDNTLKTITFPDGYKITAFSETRTLENGKRLRSQVTKTAGSTKPNGIPYMPQPYPKGVYQITGYSAQPKESAYYPYFISTSATRELHAWEVDKNRYTRESPRTFIDRGLGIHKAWYKSKVTGLWTPSQTTEGCINIPKEEDVYYLVGFIQLLLGRGEKITLEAV